MDQETREVFANLSAALAVMARRQTEHGEALAGIVRLLTEEQGKKQGVPPKSSSPSCWPRSRSRARR